MSLVRPAALAGPVLLAAAGLLAACAPVLDWREVRPPDSGVLLLMPCKPSGQERRVALAGQAVKLALHACAAGAQTWGLAVTDVADPARVAQALADLGASAAANVRAVTSRSAPLRVPGATPHAGSQRIRIQGTRPDGQPVHLELALFTQGTRVYQATALGDELSAEAADTYFSSIRIQP